MGIFDFLKKDFNKDKGPYLIMLGVVFATSASLYFSLYFSYYLFWLSIPLLAITIYLLKIFFFEKVFDNYQRDIEKNKREKFERLSSSDKEEYILNNPNSTIAKEEEWEKEKAAKERYIYNRISEVQEPTLITTLDVNVVTQKTIINNVLPFLLKDETDRTMSTKFKEEIVKHKNQKIECYEWLTQEGNKLSLKDIVEQFSLRSQRYNRISRIRFNMSPENSSSRWFKVYNDFCFYERPSSNGGRSSSVFSGKIDNKNYVNGELIG